MSFRGRRRRTLVEREGQFLHFGKGGEQLGLYEEDYIGIAHNWKNKMLV